VLGKSNFYKTEEILKSGDKNLGRFYYLKFNYPFPSVFYVGDKKLEWKSLVIYCSG